MTNKYSEGYPGARYYGGNEYVHYFRSLVDLEFILYTELLISYNMN